MISKEHVQLITVNIDYAKCDRIQYNTGASVALMSQAQMPDMFFMYIFLLYFVA